MDNFEAKWEYLVVHYGSYCPIAEENNRIAIVTDLHHLCHKTKWRIKKYPLFIHSMLNLRPVSNHWHLKYPSWGKITDFQAEKYERFLEKHKKISDFLNNPVAIYR